MPLKTPLVSIILSVTRRRKKGMAINPTATNAKKEARRIDKMGEALSFPLLRKAGAEPIKVRLNILLI